MLKCDPLARKSRSPVLSMMFLSALNVGALKVMLTPEQTPRLGGERRENRDRRSGRDTRSEAEERRSKIRRSDHDRRASEQPPKDQLSLFAKRVRRAMRDEKSRHFFGVASGED